MTERRGAAPRKGHMEARVERVESGPMLSLLFSPRPGIEVLDEQEDQLSSDSNGAIGILKFALQTRPGEPLPPGNYTVEIYGSGSGSGAGGGGPQVLCGRGVRRLGG